MSAVARRFIVPYEAGVRESSGLFVYSYWTLYKSFRLKSPTPLQAGDLVELQSVNVADRSLLVTSLGVPPRHQRHDSLVFVSNNVPLSGDEEFECEAEHCTVLLRESTLHQGNQFYTFALIVEGHKSRLWLRSLQRGQRSLFSITKAG